MPLSKSRPLRLIILASLMSRVTRALSSGSVSASASFANPHSRPHLRAIFSDIDGTLVHYAKDFEKHGVRIVSSDEIALTAVVERDTDGARRNCRLLPSSTMGPACISERTVALVDELRNKYGVMFGVVTAARRSTMLQRWPLLPVCEVRVCESGSRIYIGNHNERDDDTSSGGGDTPKGYEILLDNEFAARFETICGPMNRAQEGADTRKEPLWQFYRQLRDDNDELQGLKVDARSYYGMFRASTQSDKTGALEKALLSTIERTLPPGISCATNLGKYDFYPTAAGKGNAVRYLLQHEALRGSGNVPIAQSEAACLFDDDNDLPMAEQCGIHLLPGLTSSSVLEAAAQNPTWDIARTAGQGVFAIEECLEKLLERAKADLKQTQQQAKEEELQAILKETLFVPEQKKIAEI